MSGGRTMWRAKDAGWWSREWIVTLGEEFGADGPAVIDWLEDQAKLQNDGGRVKTGPRAVSRGCFVDAVTVGHVVSRAVTLGLLVEHEENKGRFECVIAWWKADQGKAAAATRKADQRARESVTTGDDDPVVTLGHAESRPVTLGHKKSHKQDNTVKERAKALSSSNAAASDTATRERAKASDEDRSLCRLLAEKIRERNPKAKVASDAKWLQSMRLLRELDGNTPGEIEEAILWLFTDSSDDADFWSGTIQSASGLRKHFSQVWAKMHPSRPRSNGNVVESSSDFLARRGAAA